MNKKFWFWAAALLFISVMASLFVLAKIFLSPKNLKKNVTVWAAETMKKNFNSGEMELSPGYISLNNVSFTDLEGVETKYPGHIKCSKISVRYSLLKLILRRVDIKEIIIEEADIKTLLNIEEEMKNTAAYFISLYVSSLSGGMNIEKLELRDSKIYIENYDSFLLDLGSLNLVLNKQGQRSVYGFDIDSEVKKPIMGKIRSSGQLDLIKGELNLKETHLSGLGGHLDISGQAQNIYELPKAELKFYTEDIPERLIDEKLSIKGVHSARADVGISDNKARITWNADLSKSELEYGKVLRKSDEFKLNVQGGLSWEGNSLYKLNWYVLNLGDSVISGTGRFAPDNISLIIKGQDMDINKVLPLLNIPPKSTGIKRGKADIDAELFGDPIFPEFKANIQSEDVVLYDLGKLTDIYSKLSGRRVKKFRLKTVTADLKADPDKLDIENAELKGDELDLGLKGYYKWGEKYSFEASPIINGREIGLKIYGSTTSFNVGLK